MCAYPITTSLKVVKELQYVKEITKGITPSSATFTAIPTATFIPISRARDRKYIKLGNPDVTKSINAFTNYDISITYTPITADALFESMVNLTGTNNRDDTYTLLLSQQHNNAGTLAEQYQIARGCTVTTIVIILAERSLVTVGSHWMALSISDWSTSHGLTGTPTFAPALTATPWATNETGSQPVRFLDISSGTSYDVRRFSCAVNHNTTRTQIMDQLNSVRIDSDIRDITLDVAIVFKDTQVSQTVKTFAGQDITVNLNLTGSTLTSLDFTDVFLDKYDETVNAEDRQVKVVSYSGTAASLLLRAQVIYVTAHSIQKYNMGGRVGPVTSIHKYDLASGVVTVSQTSIQKYNITAYVTATSKHKYDIGEISAFGNFEDENFVSNNFVLDS